MYSEAVSYKSIILNKNQSNFDMMSQTYQTMKYQAQITRALGAGRQFDTSYVGYGLLSTTELTNGVMSRE